jgi:uncharacterized protein (DUF488 family)
MNASKLIYTVGHSNRHFDEFMAMLQSFNIELLADVRSLPGSRKYPQYDKEALEISLPENNIEYRHLINLGGRRKPGKNTKNTGWRHPAFRGYADYMETDEFSKGIEELESAALKSQTVYMCSEAVWWRCHRAMISDYLKLRGWEVMHIMGVGKAKEHPYTSPAKIVNGKLSYEGDDGCDEMRESH